MTHQENAEIKINKTPIDNFNVYLEKRNIDGPTLDSHKRSNRLTLKPSWQLGYERQAFWNDKVEHAVLEPIALVPFYY